MVTVTKHIIDSDSYPCVGMTCSASVEILKNKVLTLSDPFTVAEVSSAASALGYVYGGVSAMDKESTDGSTQMSVIKEGYFKVYASGNVTAGQAIKSVGTGYFAAAVSNDYLSGAVAGKALETAATGETMLAYLRAV